MAFKSGWKYRHPISINNNGASPASSDHFFVEIPSWWDHFWENCESTGEDVVFTDSDGVTLLDFERLSGEFVVADRIGRFLIDCTSLTYLLLATTIYGSKQIWVYYGVEGTPTDYSTSVSATSRGLFSLFGFFQKSTLPTISVYEQRPDSTQFADSFYGVGMLAVIDFSDYLALDDSGNPYEEVSEISTNSIFAWCCSSSGNLYAFLAQNAADYKISFSVVTPGVAEPIVKQVFLSNLEATVSYV